jgi:hypothetical protein
VRPSRWLLAAAASWITHGLLTAVQKNPRWRRGSLTLLWLGSASGLLDSPGMCCRRGDFGSPVTRRGFAALIAAAAASAGRRRTGTSRTAAMHAQSTHSRRRRLDARQKICMSNAASTLYTDESSMKDWRRN